MIKDSAKIVEAFTELVNEVPCCQCCGSDSGYVDAVVDALKIIEPLLSTEEKQQIVNKAGKTFARIAGWPVGKG